MKNFKIHLNLILWSLFICCSCTSKKQVLYMQDIDAYDISKVTSLDHIIQENDILKINVSSINPDASIPYNKVSVSGSISNNLEILQLEGYLVSDNKTINFPILGEISVADTTTKDLEGLIKDRLELEGHLIKPKVIVRLINAKFTILGEVNLPGTFTFTEKNISLLQALGLAGDLTIEGNRKDIIIIRQSERKRITARLDLTSADFLSSPYQNIQPNDVIIVNPNSKKVKSAGLIGDISTALSIASIVLSSIILIR